MKKIISIIIIAVAVLVDQIVKGVLLSLVAGGWHLSGDALTLVPYPYLMARLTGWFNIVFTWNPGTSFYLFREAPSLLLIFITGAIIGYLLYILFFNIKTNIEKFAMSLIVGGAIGNLIDRVRFGAVIDFIDWHVYEWHWPAFNIADACISVGVALYILHYALIFISKRKHYGKV